jgi:hypothetical protein
LLGALPEFGGDSYSKGGIGDESDEAQEEDENENENAEDDDDIDSVIDLIMRQRYIVLKVLWRVD